MTDNAEYQERKHKLSRYWKIAKSIKDVKQEWKQNGEIFNDNARIEIINRLELENVLTETTKTIVKEVMTPYKALTSEERLKYQRELYWKKKELQKIRDKELLREQKTKEALDNRISGYCFSCLKVKPLKNKVVKVSKSRFGDEKIKVLAECKDCGTKLGFSGGKLDI